MSSALILNILLGVSIFTAILGLAGWAIRTAHHDRHAMFSGAGRRAPAHGRRSPEASGRVRVVSD